MKNRNYKIVFINNPAARSGGALLILRQFLEEISRQKDNDFIFYIFCYGEELKMYESDRIKIIGDIDTKKWRNRIIWDLYGLKNWSKRTGINADLIISLQNTAPFYYKGVPQILYIHQAIPLLKEFRWSLFKKDERLLWFYRNIYKYFIKLNLKNVNFIIVQTLWMKNRVSKEFNINPQRIKIIPPRLPQFDIDEIEKINFHDNKFHIFYPATAVKYKNHQLLIKALSLIKKINKSVYKKLQVHFTFSLEDIQESELNKIIKNEGVSDIIKLEGKMDYNSVLKFYKSVNLLVFPSYLESFPLPLLEGALFGLPILVTDLEYSREVLRGYEGAIFTDYKNYKEWVEKIIEIFNKKPRFRSWSPPRQEEESLFNLMDVLIYKQKYE